jgi:hypothetical protein
VDSISVFAGAAIICGVVVVVTMTVSSELAHHKTHKKLSDLQQVVRDMKLLLEERLPRKA